MFGRNRSCFDPHPNPLPARERECEHSLSAARERAHGRPHASGDFPPPFRGGAGGRCGIQRRRAFTLIELMVVLVVMSIAAAIVVPAMLQGGTMSVQAAGRMIIADLLVTQNEAIARMAPRRLVFDVANNAYRMTDADGNTIAADWRLGSGGGTGFEVDFTADRRFTGVNMLAASFNGDAHVEFDALGVPAAGGQVTIDGGTARYSISVQPITGRVSIAAIAQE